MKHDPVTTIEARSLLVDIRAKLLAPDAEEAVRLKTAADILSVVIGAQLWMKQAREEEDDNERQGLRMLARDKILELLE